MNAGQRVMVEMPGASYHRKIGRIVETHEDEVLGQLYFVAIEGYPEPIGLTSAKLRMLVEDAA